jgi:ABC-type branched-subunit amino acid transport system permease subunit
VLVAIRENEQRARSRAIRRTLQARRLRDLGRGDRLAGALLGVQTASASAEAVSVPFSGELLAMVVIGGMRSIPRAGARRAVLHPVPRIVFDLDAELAALVRPDLRRLRRVFADGLVGIWAHAEPAGGPRRKKPPR